MKSRSPSGFSLIEVLIAIFMIGLMLLLFQLVLKNLPLISLVKNQDLALKIAQNELEALRAGGYDAVPTSGSFSDASLTSLPSGTGALTVTAYNANTKRVDVAVTWRERNATTDSTVSITTLITETGGL